MTFPFLTLAADRCRPVPVSGSALPGCLAEGTIEACNPGAARQIPAGFPALISIAGQSGAPMSIVVPAGNAVAGMEGGGSLSAPETEFVAADATTGEVVLFRRRSAGEDGETVTLLTAVAAPAVAAPPTPSPRAVESAVAHTRIDRPVMQEEAVPGRGAPSLPPGSGQASLPAASPGYETQPQPLPATSLQVGTVMPRAGSIFAPMWSETAAPSSPGHVEAARSLDYVRGAGVRTSRVPAAGLPAADLTVPAPPVETGRSPDRAKFAPPVAMRDASVGERQNNNFLNADGEVVAKSKDAAGITVAIRSDVMPAEPVPARLAADSHTPTHAPVSVTGAGPAPGSAVEGELPAEIGGGARAAVAAVLRIVEGHASAQTHHAPVVHLNLRLADDSLAIRVELRHGEVHTQFHTDSTALRTAIGQEWAGGVADSAPRGLRFLEPQFAGTNGSMPDTFPGGGHTARDQGHGHEQPAPRPAPHPRLPATTDPVGTLESVLPQPSQHLAAMA